MERKLISATIAGLGVALALVFAISSLSPFLETTPSTTLTKTVTMAGTTFTTTLTPTSTTTNVMQTTTATQSGGVTTTAATQSGAATTTTTVSPGAQLQPVTWAVTLSTSSVSIMQGASQNVELTIRALEPVNLTLSAHSEGSGNVVCKPLPEGINVAFNHSSVSLPANSELKVTMTLSVSKMTAIGTYDVVVQAYERRTGEAYMAIVIPLQLNVEG